MPIVVFATNTQQANTDVLNAVGAQHRLLSYWYLKDLHPDWLKAYVEGTPPPTKERRHGIQKRKRVSQSE